MEYYFYIDRIKNLTFILPLILKLNKNHKIIVIYSLFDKMNKEEEIKLKTLSQINNFKKMNITKVRYNSTFILFIIEGVGIKYFKNLENSIIINLTASTDLFNFYEDYIDKINYCIFFNNINFIRNVSEQNNKIRLIQKLESYKEKNLFLGTPYFNSKKYIFGDKDIIKSKYNFKFNLKYIYFLLPKIIDLNFDDLLEIIEFFNNMGYSLILKTRNKDSYKDYLKDLKINLNYYFEDFNIDFNENWEFIYISEFVFTFDSCIFYDAYLMNKLVINFHVKPKDRSILHNYLSQNYSNYIHIENISQLQDAYNRYLKISQENINFEEIRQKLFIENYKSDFCENIINFLSNLKIKPMEKYVSLIEILKMIRLKNHQKKFMQKSIK